MKIHVEYILLFMALLPSSSCSRKGDTQAIEESRAVSHPETVTDPPKKMAGADALLAISDYNYNIGLAWGLIRERVINGEEHIKIKIDWGEVEFQKIKVEDDEGLVYLTQGALSGVLRVSATKGNEQVTFNADNRALPAMDVRFKIK